VSSDRPSVFLNNLRWGAWNGLMYAVVASVIVASVALLQGKSNFPEYGTSLATLILLYIVTGLLAGAVVGILRPWTRNPLGATVVGAIAGIPVFLVFFAVTDGKPPSLANVDWMGVLVCGVAVGGPSGYIRWWRSRKKADLEA